jgi:hypothetical protein
MITEAKRKITMRWSIGLFIAGLTSFWTNALFIWYLGLTIFCLVLSDIWPDNWWPRRYRTTKKHIASIPAPIMTRTNRAELQRLKEKRKVLEEELIRNEVSRIKRL